MASSGKKKVVIVGAGPGGAAAAVRLAQRGVRDIVLVDKDRFPRDKTCGSALSPNGVKLIEELGIGAEVHRLGYVIRSLRLVTPGRREMHLTTDTAAIILLRRYFDNLLVEKAVELGVELRQNLQITRLLTEGGELGRGGRAVGVVAKDGSEIRADYVLGADGAHSIFSFDDRPKRTISTLMGWWEDFPFQPHTIDMVFDKNLAPLYGWMFPEGQNRVNIGICMDGEEPDGLLAHKKTSRNVRQVFQQFLDENYADELKGARQIGKLKGHPISYTTWIQRCTAPGMIYLGEGARITHNATGEGIFHALQSGCYAAEAVADVLGGADENKAWSRYVWRSRQRFTFGFVMGHVLRGVLRTPLLDSIALAYNSPTVRRAATWAIGSALAGSHVSTDNATVEVREPQVRGVVPPAAAAR